MPFMTAWAERNLGPTQYWATISKWQKNFSDPFRLRNFIHQNQQQRIKALLQAKELSDLKQEREEYIKQKRMMFYTLLVTIAAITILKI